MCWCVATTVMCVLVCRLKNAEAKYAHRKSRPEDLETIRELKKIISQQEFRLKEVIVSHSRTDGHIYIYLYVFVCVCVCVCVCV